MANKTRVQVRGTIGKSVKIPVAGVTQAQLAAAIAAIPVSTTTTTAAAAPSSGVTSVGLSAASSDIVVVGTTPITTSGAWTVDLSTAVKTILTDAILMADVENSITFSGGFLELVGDVSSPGDSYYYGTNASGVKSFYALPAGYTPGTVQVMESAGFNSTSGAVQVSLTVPQDIIVPFNCTLREVDVVTQGGTGSCTINLWKAASLAAPNSGDDITGGTNVVIASGTGYSNSTLSMWITNLTQNDRILVTLAANTTFTSVKIILRMY